MADGHDRLLHVLSSGDVERCLGVIQADGRRALTQEETVSTTRFWLREFADQTPAVLEQAVLTFLREKPRGRPSIGELWAILRRSLRPVTKTDAARVQELRWAAEVMEDPGRYASANYSHTVLYAERILKHWGVTHWHDAMAETHPNWTPPTTREAYL